MYEELVGRIAEILVKVTLQNDGYLVLPYGVETALHAGTLLSDAEYAALRLPKQVRRTPDFIVINPKRDGWRLLEVKYRAAWDENNRSWLKEGLEEQASSWPNVQIQTVIATKAPNGRLGDVDSHIRVAKTQMEDGELAVSVNSPVAAKRWDEVTWSDFSPLMEAFPICGQTALSRSRLRKLAHFVSRMPDDFDDSQYLIEANREVMDGLQGVPRD